MLAYDHWIDNSWQHMFGCLSLFLRCLKWCCKRKVQICLTTRHNKRVVIHTCTYMYMVHVVLHVSEFHYDTIKDAVLCAMCQRWRAADRFSKWRNQDDAQVCGDTESSADSSRAWMYRFVCKSSKPSHVPMTPSPKYASPGYVSNPIYGSSI